MRLETGLRGGVSGWVHAGLGLAISVAFGWLAVRDVSWHAVGVSLAAIRPGWEPLVGHDPGASARRREWRRSHAMDPGEGETLLAPGEIGLAKRHLAGTGAQGRQ